MKYYLAFAVLGLFILWKMGRRAPFAGSVASGWSGGNATANLPALVPIYPILGLFGQGWATGPPGIPGASPGSSGSTNFGSGGGY